MSSKITIKPNQSVMDAVLTANGSMEAAMEFCLQNDVPISAIPAPGTEYAAVVSEADDAGATAYLAANKIVIGTANLQVCGLASAEATAIEDTTARFSITVGENAVSYQWMALPAASGHPVEGYAGSSGTLEVTGLTAGTDYKLWLRSRCLGNYSSWQALPFTTSSAAPLEMAVVLYPKQSVTSGYSAPNFYIFLNKHVGRFVSRYTLQSTYLATNKMYMEIYANYVAGGGTESYLSSSLTSMFVGGALYNKPAIPATGEYRIYWVDFTESILTHTFADVNGNEAVTAPVIIVNDAYDTTYYLQAKIDVQLVSSTTGSAVIKVTKSHPAVTAPNVTLDGYRFYGASMSGAIADPADPLNDDVRLVTLTAGTYMIGVEGNYIDASFASLPSSKMEIVIEIG